MQAANVRVPRVGCGFYEIERFQNLYLQSNIAIVVYEKPTFGNGDPPFSDGRAQVETQGELKGVINLCYDPRAKHFDTILNVIGLARTKFFCSYCNKCFHFIDQHKCRKTCSKCFVSPACLSDGIELIKCAKCNREFFGPTCYQNHLEDGSYKKKNKKLCDIVKLCTRCNKVTNRYRGQHVCGKIWCKFCKINHFINENCYMLPIKSESDDEAKKETVNT